MKYQEIELTDNQSAHHLELMVEDHTAFIDYKRSNERLFLIHTEVPDELEGKGVGSAIVEKALKYAEQNKLTIVPLCSFVQSYLKRHKEWEWIIAKDTERFT